MHAFPWSGNLRLPQLRLRTARLDPLVDFYERALGLEVDMPIAQSVVALLDGRMKPEQAVAVLMGRDPTQES